MPAKTSLQQDNEVYVHPETNKLKRIKLSMSTNTALNLKCRDLRNQYSLAKETDTRGLIFPEILHSRPQFEPALSHSINIGFNCPKPHIQIVVIVGS